MLCKRCGASLRKKYKENILTNSVNGLEMLIDPSHAEALICNQRRMAERIAELRAFVREFDEDVQRVVSAGRPLNDVRIADFSRRAKELLKR